METYYNSMYNNPVMIRCNNCGAPAGYDILHQQYCCTYCGSRVLATAVLQEKRGWREAKSIRSARIAGTLGECFYSCTGCGAKVMITAGEAMGNCGFCGGKVVRREYAEGDFLPETVIPFVLNGNEAMGQLEAWCAGNPKRPETKIIQERKAFLTGYYLPYQLVKGQTEGEVRTRDGCRRYSCRTYLNEIAINTSGQIPNDLLDAIEPFEWDKALEFDFGMLAGQRVKLQDVDEKELADRTSAELTGDFLDTLKSKFSTKGIKADVEMDTLLTLNAALPVYILDCGKVKMAINGQTGHVAVTKEEVKNHDFSILEPILITLFLFLAPFVFFGFFFQGGNIMDGLKIGLGVMFTFGLVTFIGYSQRGSGLSKNMDPILRTPPVTAFRTNGVLSIVERMESKWRPEPVIMEPFKSTGITPVDVRIYPVSRIIKWVLLLLLMNCLPIVFALLINGFHFEEIVLSGCTVWWCLSFPTTLALYLGHIRRDAFENPYFYYLWGDRRGKRVPKCEYLNSKKFTLSEAVGLLFCGPIFFLAVFLLIVLLVCSLITAGIV